MKWTGIFFASAFMVMSCSAQVNDNTVSYISDLASVKLGYRLRLTDATFPLSATAGGNFTISVNLNNDGYAGIIKTRPIYLVFDNGINPYNIELTCIDVRTWVSGPVALSTQRVNLPSGMAPGSYKLALWLPDASASLQSRPGYSVRFANHDVWDAAKGYNVLAKTLIISE